MSEFFAPGLIERLGTLWRDIIPQKADPVVQDLRPTLPDGDLEKVRQQMQTCLQGRGGEVSARARAAELGQAYLSLNDEGKERFLILLARDFDTDHQSVKAAAEKLVASEDRDVRAAAERQLRKTLEAPRRKLLTQFNGLPEGVKFLVDLRADLRALIKKNKDADLRGLEADLKYLLHSWFDVGFLELQRITWDSPASLLEKIVAYEAVHTIRDWADLKNRLDSDRRLYAFFHPRMPDEPLIFVQVALLNGLAGNIQELLDPSAPVGDSAKADTAIFYSISSAQRGLDGISFGNFLIKKVVKTLSTEFPNLKNFATLSPMPRFKGWLEQTLKDDGVAELLTPAEKKALRAASRGDAAGSAEDVLRAAVENPQVILDNEALEPLVKAPILRLAARYLAMEKRPPREDGGVPTALNSVAHFHLTNGARIERVNWKGDLSPNGLKQSCGLMVNYLYKISEIERNHEIYSEQGKAVLSTAVRGLLKE